MKYRIRDFVHIFFSDNIRNILSVKIVHNMSIATSSEIIDVSAPREGLCLIASQMIDLQLWQGLLVIVVPQRE